jgi:hypothetical protein
MSHGDRDSPKTTETRRMTIMEKSGKDKEKGQKADAAKAKNAGATTVKKLGNMIDFLTTVSDTGCLLGQQFLELADKGTTGPKEIRRQLQDWGYMVSLKDVTLMFKLYKENPAIGEFAHTIY